MKKISTLSSFSVLAACLITVNLVLPLNAIAATGSRVEPGADPTFQAGKKTFGRYCAKCHGKGADGEGRMARLYRKLQTQLPSNFTIGVYLSRPDIYLREVISKGGAASAMSQYMPPFGEELSHEQIDNLVHFIKRTPELHGFSPEK